MTEATAAEQRARQFVRSAIEEYVQKRLEYYTARRGLLDDLLKKDAMIWALRGAVTSSDWVDGAFAAHESSSEETMMGNAWQKIFADLAPGAIGAGDFLVERDGVLWVIEMKSQTNTLSAAARAQTLKTLHRKVREYARVRTPRARAVQAMIGILRGPPADDPRTYVANSPEDQVIDGFPYREMVGIPFRAFFTGMENPAALIDDIAEGGRTLAAARAGCAERLKAEIRTRLQGVGLPDEMSSVILLVSEHERELAARRARARGAR